ncbi:MAG: PRC-barrel domain-containing protein, partial [Armatimonadetes bacterium]|nr:PRC-barrel domain-containing protein [Armatimonadota bacterium]
MRAGSYSLIRPGMLVMGPDGERIGRVAEVLFDETTGIFHGLVVERGLRAPRAHVLGEHIQSVEENTVVLDVPGSELPRHRPPAERHGPP